MKDIITLTVGGCGSIIGYNFFEIISQEHQIINGMFNYQSDNDILIENASSYFEEYEDKKQMKFRPRAILVDLDPIGIDFIRKAPGCLGSYTKASNFISGIRSANRNFIYGFKTTSKEFQNQIKEIIRKQAETLDNIEGFNIMRSLSGGTGGGLTPDILTFLNQEYSKKVILDFSVVACKEIGDNSLCQYNNLLSLAKNIETDSLKILYDNMALYSINKHIRKNEMPNYVHLNYIIANSISNITSLWRFPCSNNFSCNKFSMNLIQNNDKLDYISVSMSPFSSKQKLIQKENDDDQDESANQQSKEKKKQEEKKKYFEKQIENACLDDQYSLTNYIDNSKQDAEKLYRKIFHQHIIIRDKKLQLNQIESVIQQVANHIKQINKQQTEFSQFELTHCKIPLAGFQQTVTVVSNQTTIKNTIERIYTEFNSCYKKKLGGFEIPFQEFFLGVSNYQNEMIQVQELIQKLNTKM